MRSSRGESGPSVLGVRLAIATPEDIVLAKLEWSSSSGSERQFTDVAAILSVNDDLDRNYLRRWAVELGVEERLRQAEVAARPSEG